MQGMCSVTVEPKHLSQIAPVSCWLIMDPILAGAHWCHRVQTGLCPLDLRPWWRGETYRKAGVMAGWSLWEEVTPSAEAKGKGKAGTSWVRCHTEKGLVYERTEKGSKAEGAACADVFGHLRC